MMLLILILPLLFTLTESQGICADGCNSGPIPLPYYFCQCPLSVNPELSHCLVHCATDVICRFCEGDRKIGIPRLCPLTVSQKLDLSGQNFTFVIQNGSKIRGLDKAVPLNTIFFDPATRVGRATLIMDLLTVEGDYTFNGIICGNTPLNSQGTLTIKFQNLTADWYPKLDFNLNCNTLFLYVNAPYSAIILSTNKKVIFEFTETGNSTAGQISKCFNDNWQEVLGKIVQPLNVFFNQFCADFSNIILNKVPFINLFSYGSTTPIASVGIPSLTIPLPNSQINLPIGNGILTSLIPGGGIINPISGLLPNLNLGTPNASQSLPLGILPPEIPIFLPNINPVLPGISLPVKEPPGNSIPINLNSPLPPITGPPVTPAPVPVKGSGSQSNGGGLIGSVLGFIG